MVNFCLIKQFFQFVELYRSSLSKTWSFVFVYRFYLRFDIGNVLINLVAKENGVIRNLRTIVQLSILQVTQNFKNLRIITLDISDSLWIYFESSELYFVVILYLRLWVNTNIFTKLNSLHIQIWLAIYCPINCFFIYSIAADFVGFQ